MGNPFGDEARKDWEERGRPMYEEDMYSDPQGEEIDILAAGGKEKLRAMEDVPAIIDSWDGTTIATRGPETYRSEALNILATSGVTYTSVNALLWDADQVAAWLAGEPVVLSDPSADRQGGPWSPEG